MVFVHTRNGTAQTALVLKEKASQNGELGCFEPVDNSQLGIARNAMKGSRNKQLQVMCMFYSMHSSLNTLQTKPDVQELFPAGFGIHHAGMLRSDRNLVEKYFSQGLIKVTVTAPVQLHNCTLHNAHNAQLTIENGPASRFWSAQPPSPGE